MSPNDELISRWFGTYRVRDGRAVAGVEAPRDAAALAERVRQRLDGERTPEEGEVLRGVPPEGLRSWDRRFALVAPTAFQRGPDPPEGFDAALHREALLLEAERRLREGWDPSVHLNEAVRAIRELDETLNLLGERIVSWSARDGPPDDEEITAAAAARSWLAAGETYPSPTLPGVDPALAEARRELAKLYEGTSAARSALENAIAEAMPRRAPNLSALLGPILAARLVALAGGLDRLARLPAGTVQVLGAEKAFFEHLRGRAPPPRHGVLFLHPKVQSTPRRIRGRIARALAGKAAIAARLDSAGAELRPDLVEQFERRARSVRSEGAGRPATRSIVRPRSPPST